MSSTDKNLFSYTPLNNYKEYFLYALIYVVFIALMQHTCHGGDIYCWNTWTAYMLNNGIGNIYNSGSNYPPLYYYVLDAYGNLMGNEESISQNIYCLKAITFLFEFASVFLLFRYVKKEYQPWFFLFIVLNPGFFYNSLIWGQVDGIFGFLSLSMFLLVIYRQNTLAMLFFILCLNFKIQAIVFLPLLVLLLIHNLSDFKGLLYALYVLLALICLQVLIILPFIENDATAVMFQTMFESVGKYPKVSMNAYNMYYWFFEGDLMMIEDSGIWNGLSYKNWGLLSFFFFSGIALVPVCVTSLLSAWNRNKNSFQIIEKIFLSAALITLAFFFFNTQMHERYSHYALIFLAAYFAVSGNYLPFLCCATACFLNEEAVLQALRFPNYGTLMFNPKAVAVLYGFTILYLYYLLYKGSHVWTELRMFQKR